jgi:hypothetical protein
MQSLVTIAEQSRYRRTGRIDEVERLSAELARTWPQHVRSFEYGRSAEGRPLRALIVSRAGVLTADEIKRRRLPLLMIQGGIHPGESDGKDAGFIALREMLSGNSGGAALERIALLFVPAFNTDGHERFGAWNRPNQIGPEEMGWRATAQNLNLNRDYMKADAPEMQAMLQLLNEWDPLACADLHVTDGADFEPDISIQVEPINQGDPALHADGVQMRDLLIERLAAQGSLPLPFYPDLTEMDNPASGFHLTVYSPRFSTGYFAYRNRFTILVETHSWKSYETRVRVTRNTIVSLAELVAEHGAKWLSDALSADERAKSLPGNAVNLDFAAGWREPTKDGQRQEVSAGEQGADANTHLIDFRGYAYTRKVSSIFGEPVTVYDPSKPEIWRVPLRMDTTPSLVVSAPRGGYIVPAAYAQTIGAKLALHGIEFEQLEANAGPVKVLTFRAKQAHFSSTPFEGRMTLQVGGEWREDSQVIPPGSLFVPIRQARARLITALLEPQAPDSFAAWGFFNGCFEHKEYMEPYVAEIIAREMLERDPELAAEFDRQLATDIDFANDPAARREFFHRRHPSWDARFNLYPIYKQ